MDEPVTITRHKLDVDDYYRMTETGIIAPDARVELIDGEIIDMPSMGPDHAAIVARLTEELVLVCARKTLLRCQLPIRIDRYNEPEPDFSVCHRRPDTYRAGHPHPEDVVLLVEVANSSLRFDRKVKLPLYARAGIPEVWILDLNQRTIDVHRHPSGATYATADTHGPGGRIAPAAAPEIEVDLATIFY